MPLTLAVAMVCLAGAVAALLVYPARVQSSDGAAVDVASVATAPSNLTIEIEGGEFLLGWDAPTEDGSSVTGYLVLRSHAGLQLTTLKATGSTETYNWDRSAKRPGLTYTYQVKALRGVVASEGSNQVSVTSPDLCSGSGFNSTPENVPVTATPIVVTSTSTDYFVLFVRPDLNLDHEIPISVTLGEDGETTLTEQLSALPVAHYRVEKYSVDDPGDVDGDCTHDIDELADVGTMNPVNPARSIDLINGTTAIPDRATFEHLSYQGRQVVIDDHLRDLEFVKFYLYDMDTDRPAVYFMNTVTHRAHHSSAFSVYVPQRGRMRGEIVYHPNVAAADGSLGVYRFEFEPGDSYAFEAVQYAYETLAASMPLLENNLAYYPMPLRALPLYNTEKTKYDASRVNILRWTRLVGQNQG